VSEGGRERAGFVRVRGQGGGAPVVTYSEECIRLCDEAVETHRWVLLSTLCRQLRAMTYPGCTGAAASAAARDPAAWKAAGPGATTSIGGPLDMAGHEGDNEPPPLKEPPHLLKLRCVGGPSGWSSSRSRQRGRGAGEGGDLGLARRPTVQAAADPGHILHARDAFWGCAREGPGSCSRPPLLCPRSHPDSHTACPPNPENALTWGTWRWASTLRVWKEGDGGFDAPERLVNGLLQPYRVPRRDCWR
jgi:hypothetical protein